MSETDRTERDSAVDANATAFKTPPVEGIPYAKGSIEDQAVRRVVERTERERQAADEAETRGPGSIWRRLYRSIHLRIAE